MLFASWNVRGLNSPNKQNEVKNFIASNKLGLVDLIETQIREIHYISTLSNMFRGWGSFIKNAHHPHGRIWIVWRPQYFCFQIKEATSQVVHCLVTHLESSSTFFVTFVYGLNREEERRALWDDLSRIAQSTSLAWCVLGDFNSLLQMEERLGGARVLPHELADFHRAVEECFLEDLPYSGSFYTWSNRSHNGGRIYSKIDRVLVNQEWRLMWGHSRVVFLPEGISPAIVKSGIDVCYPSGPFRYCETWETHPNFLGILQTVWNKPIDGCYMYQIIRKLHLLKQPLKQLHRSKFSAIHDQVDILRVKLHDAQRALQLDPLNQQLHNCEIAIREDFESKLDAFVKLL